MSKILADFSKSLHLGPHQAPMQGDGGLRLRAHPKQWTDDPPKKHGFFDTFWNVQVQFSFFGIPVKGTSHAETKPPHAR